MQGRSHFKSFPLYPGCLSFLSGAAIVRPHLITLVVAGDKI
jgi:hypothetical protein